MTDHTITLIADYVQPTLPLESNTDYLNMVINMAAQSYMNQYGAASPEEGVAAARLAFNKSLPTQAHSSIQDPNSIAHESLT